jgi:predicted Zn-dependent protease
MTEEKDVNVQLLEVFQRSYRFNKISIYAMLALVIVLVPIDLYVRHRLLEKHMQSYSEPDVTWQAAFDLMKQDKDAEAMRMALILYKKHPDRWYPNSCLARILYETGDLQGAEKYAAKAYELCPSEDNEKYLAMVRKHIAILKTTFPTSAK